jgi:hypothetical protein
MSGLHPDGSRDAQSSCIPSEETIIRRLPPDRVKHRPRVGTTATSFGLKPRRGEYPSWSRKGITSPRQLVAIEEKKGRNITGWHVCEVAVSTVRELGLDVLHEPTEEDKGHCVIVPTKCQPFTDSVWSKLAQQARVIYTHKPEP